MASPFRQKTAEEYAAVVPFERNGRWNLEYPNFDDTFELHDTEQQALDAKALNLARLREREAAAAARMAADTAAAEAEAALVASYDGFLPESPLERGAQRKVLETMIRTDGRELTRKADIEDQVVQRGSRFDSEGRLVDPQGMYRPLNKTETAYAEHLIERLARKVVTAAAAVADIPDLTLVRVNLPLGHEWLAGKPADPNFVEGHVARRGPLTYLQDRRTNSIFLFDESPIVGVAVLKTAVEVVAERTERKFGEIAYKQPTTRDEYEATLWDLAARIGEQQRLQDARRLVAGESLKDSYAPFRRSLQLEAQFNRVADEIDLAKTKRKYMRAAYSWKVKGSAMPSPWDLAAPEGPDAVNWFDVPKPTDFHPDPVERRKRSPKPPEAYQDKSGVEASLRDARDRLRSRTISDDQRAKFERIVAERERQLATGQYREAAEVAWAAHIQSQQSQGKEGTNMADRKEYTESDAREAALHYVGDLLAKGYTSERAAAEVAMGMANAGEPGYEIKHGKITVPSLGETKHTFSFAALALEVRRGQAEAAPVVPAAPGVLVAPVVTLHGTSAAEVFERTMDARAAVMKVADALGEVSPNGRDYYPQGNEALGVAVREWNECLTAANGIAADLLWLADPEERALQPARQPTRAAIPAAPSAVPTIHTNGTALGALKDGSRKVQQAAGAALLALAKIVPSGRDYATPEALALAREQHGGRVDAINRIATFFTTQIGLAMRNRQPEQPPVAEEAVAVISRSEFVEGWRSRDNDPIMEAVLTDALWSKNVHRLLGGTPADAADYRPTLERARERAALGGLSNEQFAEAVFDGSEAAGRLAELTTATAAAVAATRTVPRPADVADLVHGFTDDGRRYVQATVRYNSGDLRQRLGLRPNGFEPRRVVIQQIRNSADYFLAVDGNTSETGTLADLLALAGLPGESELPPPQQPLSQQQPQQEELPMSEAPQPQPQSVAAVPSPAKWQPGADLGPRMAKAFNDALSSARRTSQTFRTKTGVRGVSEELSQYASWMPWGGPGTNKLYEPGVVAIQTKHGSTVTKDNYKALIAEFESLERAMAADLMVVDETITPEEDARRKAALAEQNRKREEANAKVEESKKALAAVKPSWAKALIVAELIKDESDPNTDYWGHSVQRTVLIGFRSNEREDFREMRQAAAQFPETAHLAEADSKVEHRDKSTGGGGYFLSTGGQHSSGWRVRAIVERYESTRAMEIAEHLKNPQRAVPAQSAAMPVTSGATTQPVGKAGGVVASRNQEKGGVEVRFPAKPDSAVIDELKTHRFQWSGFSKCWWAKFTPERWDFASALAHRLNGTAPAQSPQPEAPEAVASRQYGAPLRQYDKLIDFKKALRGVLLEYRAKCLADRTVAVGFSTLIAGVSGQAQRLPGAPVGTNAPTVLSDTVREVVANTPELREFILAEQDQSQQPAQPESPAVVASPRYESTTQPGLFFWAERNSGPVESWVVIGQAAGGAATEAHDDLFANFKDADEIAQGLARGVDLEAEAAPATDSNSSVTAFRNWCLAGQAAIRHAVPGQKLTEEEAQAVIALMRKNGLEGRLSASKATVELWNGSTSRLRELWEDHGSYAAGAEKRQQAEDERTAAEAARKAARSEELAQRSATVTWINGVFGADAMNDANRLSMARYLDGADKQYQGISGHKWSDGLAKLGLLVLAQNPESRLSDIMPQIKAAFAAQAQKIDSTIKVAADSAEKVRPCDAWRVFDTAQSLGVLAGVKALLKDRNPAAYEAMCEYERDETADATKAPEQAGKFMVQSRNLGTMSWSDAEWTEDDKPLRFDTKEAAEQAIDEFVRERHDPHGHGYTRDDFRAVPVPVETEKATTAPAPEVGREERLSALATAAELLGLAEKGSLPGPTDSRWDGLTPDAINETRLANGKTVAILAAETGQLDSLPPRLLVPEVIGFATCDEIRDTAFHWACANAQVGAIPPASITPEVVSRQNALGQQPLDLASQPDLAALTAAHREAITAAQRGDRVAVEQPAPEVAHGTGRRM